MKCPCKTPFQHTVYGGAYCPTCYPVPTALHTGRQRPSQVWHWSPTKINLSLTKSLIYNNGEIWALWSGLLMCLINVGLKSLSGYEYTWPKTYRYHFRYNWYELLHNYSLLRGDQNGVHKIGGGAFMLKNHRCYKNVYTALVCDEDAIW